MPPRRSAVALVWALHVAAWTPAASAADKPAPRGAAQDKTAEGNKAHEAEAEAAFQEGRALLARGELDAACAKLAERLRLDVGIGTMLYLGECYERAGRTASAWRQFRDAEDLARRSKDAREKLARERADKLEPRLARLAVVVPPSRDVPGLGLVRDDEPIPESAWGRAMPVDPGRHKIVARAPARGQWSATVDVGAGSKVQVVMGALVEEAAPAAAPVAPAAAPPPALTTPKLVAIGLASAAVVGVAVGAAFGLEARSALSDSEPRCDARFCDAEGLALRDDARSRATVSTAALVTSGVLLAGAAALWLFWPPAKKSARVTSPWPRAGALVLPF